MPAPTSDHVLPAPEDAPQLRATLARHSRWGHAADADDARRRLALLRVVEAIEAVQPSLLQAEREALTRLVNGRS